MARPRAASRRGRSPLAWVLGGLVIALLVGGLGLLAAGEVGRQPPGARIADLGNEHISRLGDPHLPYNSVPPTSGPHIGNLAPIGVHQEQIPDELQVHNLEDGNVVVHYDCPQGCPGLVRQLEEVVNQGVKDNQKVILEPYAGIRTPGGTPARIALTAWTRIDAFDEFDRERIVRFIEAHEGVDHHARSGL